MPAMLGLLENKKMVKPNVQEVIEDYEWGYDETSDAHLLLDVGPGQGGPLLYEELTSTHDKLYYSFDCAEIGL